MRKEKVIYARLRFERERIGVTQDIFANLIGCKTENYANKERGRIPWSLKECYILRDYVNKRLREKGENELTIDVLFFPEKVACTPTKRKKSPA